MAVAMNTLEYTGLISFSICYYWLYHPAILSFTRTATSYDSLTPLKDSSVYCLTGSIEISKGTRHIYHPAQKLPTDYTIALTRSFLIS